MPSDFRGKSHTKHASLTFGKAQLGFCAKPKHASRDWVLATNPKGSKSQRWFIRYSQLGSLRLGSTQTQRIDANHNASDPSLAFKITLGSLLSTILQTWLPGAMPQFARHRADPSAHLTRFPRGPCRGQPSCPLHCLGGWCLCPNSPAGHVRSSK